MSFCRLFCGATALALAMTAPLRAQTRIDLALVLAVDASGSVNQHRFELQKQGYVAAFRDPRVLNAVRSGANQAIAVTMFQWTGPRLQAQVVPWMIVKDAASAEALAAAIEDIPRRLFGGGTSISGAIDYARVLLAQAEVAPARRVIDVSGDGSNNSGRPVTAARDEAVGAGIGINGLPILALEPDLDDYYRDSVIGGPGAFMVPAANFETFGEAILKKLITEIAAGSARPMLRSAVHATPAPLMQAAERKFLISTASADPTARTRFGGVTVESYADFHNADEIFSSAPTIRSSRP